MVKEQLPESSLRVRDLVPRLGWYVFLIVAVMECLLFLQTFRRDVAGGYPMANDQSAYLKRAYDIYENIQAKGLVAGLTSGIWTESPTGVALFSEGAFAMYLFGNGRLACLSLNMLFYLLAQLAITLAWTRATRSFATGLFSWGLFLAVTFPFYWAGGLFDFRLDLAGVCLFSIFSSAVVCSDYFAVRKYSVIAALAATLMIATRFLTVVYFAGIIIVFAIYLVFQIFRGRRRKSEIPEAKRPTVRFINLLLTVAIPVVFTVPLLLHNTQAIHHYYGIGHVLGDEKKIRAAEMGVSNSLESATFYPKSAYNDHLGHPVTWIVGALILAGIAATLLRSRVGTSSGAARSADYAGIVFLGACAAVPYLALTTDISKSQVVGAIFIPGTLGLGLLGYSALVPSLRRWRMLWPISVAMLSLGLVFNVSNFVKPSNHSLHPDHAEAVLSTYSAMVEIIQNNRLKNPRIAFVVISDAVSTYSLNIWYYEKTGVWLNPTIALGGTIFAMSSAEIKAGLEQADIIALWDFKPTLVYPFHQSIANNWGSIVDYCENEALPYRTIRFPSSNLTLYQKVNFVPQELSGEWITETGITYDLAQVPVGFDGQLILAYRIPGFVNFHGVPPVPQAILQQAGREDVILPSRIVGEGLEAQLQVKLQRAQSSAPGRISIKFSKYFIPKVEGINADDRHLSVMFTALRVSKARY